MIDPRHEAVFVRAKDGSRYEDLTAELVSYAQTGAARVELSYISGKSYPYSASKVVIVRGLTRLELGESPGVEIYGQQYPGVTEIWSFEGLGRRWWRVFYRFDDGERYVTYPEEDVRLFHDVSQVPQVADVLTYWRSIVKALPDLGRDQNPLQRAYGLLDSVHPDSVLSRYLTQQQIEPMPDGRVPIFPFLSNLSQREAVQNALLYPISVVDGPPGTGKTQTILNLVATLIATPGVSIGVVSFNNSAVDNVREKLEAAGFGYVVANLGRREKKDEFLGEQANRNRTVDDLLGVEPETAPSIQSLAKLNHRLDRLQSDERRLAQLRQDLDAYRLEFRHFEMYLKGHEVASLDGLSLLTRSPDRILDYLAETQLPEGSAFWPPRWVRRLRSYVRYGSLQGVDPSDSEAVLALQRSYYQRKIRELEAQVTDLERAIGKGSLAKLVECQGELSRRLLRTSLRARYASLKRVHYDSYSVRDSFSTFVNDYPVILSTCHSLRSSIGKERLLDYLIVDEASQVDLLTAALALASCRRVVIVGDLRQLPHIADDTASTNAGAPPHPVYDYARHSILSSMLALYGDDLPRTMLREHYRCDPAIIGFCNEKFYDGKLIPFTQPTADQPSLVIHRTVEGNHMRQHAAGGRSNRREVEVIRDEVLPQLYKDGFDTGDVGITTPYRRQVDKARELVDELMALEGSVHDVVEADTVHRFQGREKPAIVMTTVLDETWRGRLGTNFVDDPHLVNVAVSRAQKRFVLVTNHDMLPTSRHLRDLMEYIKYQDPDRYVRDSSVVSVFDLLYRDFAARLRPLAARLRGERRYRSEDIVWTVLHEILAEDPYEGLEVRPQVLLSNLLPDRSRLSPAQASYVKHRASVDFIIYRRIGCIPLLAIEVDGFAFHENRPDQLERDALKDAILSQYGLSLLRLPTTGSGEPERIRGALDALLADGAW